MGHRVPSLPIEHDEVEIRTSGALCLSRCSVLGAFQPGREFALADEVCYGDC